MTKKLLLTAILFLGLQTFLQAQQCGGRFTDPAGPNAVYSNNMDYTVTIAPINPGDVVTVTFTAFNTEANWDALYVFDGNSIAAPQIASSNPGGNVPGNLAGGYWGTLIPGPFTSTSIDGSLTFRFRSDNSGFRDGWIANVTCAPPPTCRRPTGVIASAINSTSARLRWTEAGTATVWDTYLVPTGQPAPTDSSDGIITSSSNPVTYNELTPNTCYTLYVRSRCSDTDKSEWTTGYSFCTPIAPPACGGQFVDSGGLNGDYGNNIDSTTTICPANQGELVTVTFTSFTTETNFDALYVFNGNSIAAPQIRSTNGAGQVPGGLTGGFWGNLIPGPFTSSSSDGCLTFRFRSDGTGIRSGWVANITCALPPTCPAPTTLGVNSITHNTATLNWVDSSTPSGWEAIVLPSGSPAPTANTEGIPASSNSVTVNTLLASTCYTFYVRRVCSETDKSAWAGGFNFCTTVAPPVCGGQFFDNGGPNFMYTNNSDTTTTICPTNPNEIVTVAFSSFDVETGWDALYVFDGNSIAAPQIASNNPADNVPGAMPGGFWGTTNPGPFTSTSTDGCLTFRFRSDNSDQRNGWIANITCAPDPDKLLLIAFTDSNTNGIKDVGEALFPNGNFIYQQNNNGTDVNAYSPTGQYALYDSNPSNTYAFRYQVQPPYNTYYSSGTTSYTNISIATGSGSQALYFPIVLTQPYNDLSVSLSPISVPRPGFTYINRITYKNLGVASTGGTLTFTKPAQVTAVTAAQPGVVNNVSGFTYAFANLLPNETRTFLITMTVPSVPLVNINDLLTASVSVTTPTADITPANNSNSSSQIVVNSYDPNDKMESRGKTIPFNMFTQDDYFFYTIRFQNNGTANAIDVKIEDLLNAKIDETSVMMVSSSHNYTMKRIGNQLVWDFKNIFLTPASVNDNSSKGYIQFKVKLKPGFQAGDIIPNSASIFFDSNPAIITAVFNTKFTTPLDIAGNDGSSLLIYPNPAKSTVHIGLRNSTEMITTITIYDIMGKSVKLISNISSDQSTVDISHLSKGIYMVEIITDNHLKQIRKLIIE